MTAISVISLGVILTHKFILFSPVIRLHEIKFFFFLSCLTGCAVEGNDVISPHVRFFCAVGLCSPKRRNDQATK